MKQHSAMWAALALALLLSGCGGAAGESGAPSESRTPRPSASQLPASQTPAPQPTGSQPPASQSPAGGSAGGLYVEKVENLPSDFILGMDASCVPSLERSGVKFYDFDGNEADVYQILADNGINYIRVRIWNDPYDGEGHGYGGGNCDVENAVEIGKRATAAGMRLFVDFHYSDFWADPGRQLVPKGWAEMGMEEKTAALREFTTDSLNRLKAAGVDVGMVQVGNETVNALAGESDWDNICALMKAGTECVRAVFPQALAALHFTEPQDGEKLLFLAEQARRCGVDYDVFAVSYYPYWHGTLEDLGRNLTAVAERYGKQVMVAENAYPYTFEDGDFEGNIIGEGTWLDLPYPVTVQGQVSNVRDIVDTVVNHTKNGIGYCYWEGTWISVGGASRAENMKLWEEYGSGWATSAASVYDPEFVGEWYGGSAVDNQAFFDSTGHPLESLKVFSLMGEGYGEPPAETPAPTPTPTPAPAPEGDLLQNSSFEDNDDGAPWVAVDLTGKMDELHLENKPSDARTGSQHYHFWSAAANTVEFTLEQTVDGLAAGKYDFAVSVMGGSGGETDIYAYVKVNGETVGTAPMGITVYNVWDTGRVAGFSVSEGETVTVGIYVKCAGPGAWGKIDDGILTCVTEG